jgi:SAM-dependent methyltransferase
MFNIIGAVSQAAVDETNREFYGSITYPWPQVTYPLYSDPLWGTVFTNQEIGDWAQRRIPVRARIWVAGCGTNQATLTALKFPKADILATDISTPSLAVCERNLAQLDIKNVELKEENLNEVRHVEEFDYIVCTGVIHHNADPSIPLATLAAGLKTDGVLELGVYNYYHRILTTAFQKAMRYLFKNDPSADVDEQLRVTAALMNKFPLQNTMSFYLHQNKEESREFIADSFLQPVEHSFTVESLAALLESEGLEIIQPCIDVFDKVAGRLSWNLQFDDERAARNYDALDDLDRWKISNLLMVEKSLSLYFYVQRAKSGFKRKSEQEMCNDFLATKFERYSTTMKNFIGSNGTYKLNPTPIPHPSPLVPVDLTARRVFKEASGEKTIGEILEVLNIKPNFHIVNALRIQLTTPLFPYLKAV